MHRTLDAGPTGTGEGRRQAPAAVSALDQVDRPPYHEELDARAVDQVDRACRTRPVSGLARRCDRAGRGSNGGERPLRRDVDKAGDGAVCGQHADTRTACARART